MSLTMTIGTLEKVVRLLLNKAGFTDFFNVEISVAHNGIMTPQPSQATLADAGISRSRMEVQGQNKLFVRIW